MTAGRTMVPPPSTLPAVRATELIRADGRPTPAFREQLRRIPSWRNAGSVAFLYAQTSLFCGPSPGRPAGGACSSGRSGFLLMGRAHAQFASLMHEAAHRLLFSNRRANDLVGRWLLGYPSFTPTDALPPGAHGPPPRGVRARRARHPAVRRLPDHRRRVIAPQADPRRRRAAPAGSCSRAQLRGCTRPTSRSGRTIWKILGVPGGAARRAPSRPAPGGCTRCCWLRPYLTVWRVINRLRSIAEHGGMQRSKDRRSTTHSVRQHPVARFLLVPYHIGWHLAHHVDSGVPFRNLPTLPPRSARGRLRRRHHRVPQLPRPLAGAASGLTCGFAVLDAATISPTPRSGNRPDAETCRRERCARAVPVDGLRARPAESRPTSRRDPARPRPDRAAGRGARDHGPQRLGQVHARQHPARPARSTRSPPARSSSTATTSPTGPPTSGPRPACSSPSSTRRRSPASR